MKDIKSLLHKIDIEEKTIEKIGIFLKTKRGKKFVSKLYSMPLRDLCRTYQAPKFVRLYKADWKNTNLIKAAIKKYNVSIPEYSPPEICVPERIKVPVFLTKKEMHEIDARRPKKLGFAARMHAYEEQKMAKFKAKYIPTEDAVNQDIFAEELKSQIKTQLYIHREYVRNFLSRAYYQSYKMQGKHCFCSKYCPLVSNKKCKQNDCKGSLLTKEPFYRLFLVFDNKTIPGTVYEVEGDPYIVGYPFCTCTEKTPIEILKNILRERAKTLRNKECLELKLYNKYGILLACVKIQKNNAQ